MRTHGGAPSQVASLRPDPETLFHKPVEDVDSRGNPIAPHDPNRPGLPGPIGLGPNVPPLSSMFPPVQDVEGALPSASINTPVDAVRLYSVLDFNPDGTGSILTAALDPFDGWDAEEFANDARQSMVRLISQSKLPAGVSDNESDAFRHALWSYKMAKHLSRKTAKKFADAYEISEPNRIEIRLMDLYNNEVGRRLAADPANHNRPDEEVILEALRQGLLRTRPFNVGHAPAPSKSIYTDPGVRSFLGRIRRILR